MGFSIGGIIDTVGNVLLGNIPGAIRAAPSIFNGGGGGSRAPASSGQASELRQLKTKVNQLTASFGSQVGPFPVITSFAPGAVARGAVVAGGAIAAAIPFFGNGNGRTVGAILAEARENTGRPATSRAIRLAARVCGLETTAGTFGISVEDVCFIVVNSGRRRARGISAADLRRTRSTLRKMNTMRKSFRGLMTAR